MGAAGPGRGPGWGGPVPGAGAAPRTAALVADVWDGFHVPAGRRGPCRRPHPGRECLTRSAGPWCPASPSPPPARPAPSSLLPPFDLVTGRGGPGHQTPVPHPAAHAAVSLTSMFYSFFLLHKVWPLFKAREVFLKTNFLFEIMIDSREVLKTVGSVPTFLPQASGGHGQDVASPCVGPRPLPRCAQRGVPVAPPGRAPPGPGPSATVPNTERPLRRSPWPSACPSENAV